MENNRHRCSELSDQQIIDLAMKEMDHFACLYKRYEKKMIHYIIRLSGRSIEEAEDILQEAFIKVWKNLNNYDPGQSFSSWLYRIVHNETISHWRKEKRNETIEITPSISIPDMDLMDFDFIPVSDVSEDLFKQIHLYIGQLKKEYRQVLILKYFENLRYEEISDVLTIPEGTVATRINRAKKALKKIYQKNNSSIK